MRRLRVYVDTSVFGGVNDDEFAVPSARFFARVRRREFIVLVSLQTAAELRHAPEAVRKVLADLPDGSVETVAIDRVRMFNGVNAVAGYRALDIRSPFEVEHDDGEQDV